MTEENTNTSTDSNQAKTATLGEAETAQTNQEPTALNRLDSSDTEAAANENQTPEDILTDLKAKKEKATIELQSVSAQIEILETLTKEIAPLVSEYEKTYKAALEDNNALQQYLVTRHKEMDAAIPQDQREKATTVSHDYAVRETEIKAANENAPAEYRNAKHESDLAQIGYNTAKDSKQNLDRLIRTAKELKEKIDAAYEKRHATRAYFLLLRLKQQLDEDIATALKTKSADLRDNLIIKGKELQERKGQLKEAELAKNKAEKEYKELPKLENEFLNGIEE